MIDLDNAPLDQGAIEAGRAYWKTLPTIATGLVTHVSLHWSATPYGWAIQKRSESEPIPYNAVADISSGNVILVPGMDPLKNARDIGFDERGNPVQETMDVTYCASCWHRNSHGLSVSAACLGDDQVPSRVGPSFFGPYPPTARQVDFMLAAAAAISKTYSLQSLDPKAVFTHAEAAILDHYFLGEDSDCRYDWALLEASNASANELRAQAVSIGNAMRRRIRLYKLAL